MIEIRRFGSNPLITPASVPSSLLKWYPRSWRGIFNCGVIFDTAIDRFRMLFRIGVRMFSSLGYAESWDGVNWNISEKPALKFWDNHFWNFRTICGIEDPRIVKWVNGCFYIFATAGTLLYNLAGGAKWSKFGIWKTRDFENFEWVGAPIKGERKNAAVFSEPFGPYAYLIFRQNRCICLARSKDLTLQSGWSDCQILLSPGQVYQDAVKRQNRIGLAGPPVKLENGWLIVFHVKQGKGLSGANFRYTLGFMVVDKKDPSKILYLPPAPVLRPEKLEELYGHVRNVVFSCATVDLGPRSNRINIYWGAGDTSICGGYLEKDKIMALIK